MALVQETAGPLALEPLRAGQAEALAGSLGAIEGRKTVLVEGQLLAALPTLLDPKSLETQDVAAVLPLASRLPQGAAEAVVYVLRPETHALELVAGQILEARRRGATHRFHALFVTRFPRSVEKLLDSMGGNAYAELDRHVETLELHWFPLEADVLSMELPLAARTALVEHSLVDVHTFALGLSELEAVYGPIARVRGKGPIAHRVAQTLRQLRAEGSGGCGSSGAQRPEIRELIIVDRAFDAVTPLMTQLTYEGLLYEAFKTKLVRPGKADTVSANVLSIDGPVLDFGPDSVVRVSLCSNDPVFRLIRDEPMGRAARRVGREIEEVSRLHQAAGGLQDKSISHLREYTQALKEAKEKEPFLGLHSRIIKHLRTHTNTRAFSQTLALDATLVQSRVGSLSWGPVMDQIEAMALSQQPLEHVLRLLALASLTQDGLDAKRLDAVRRLVVECYGQQHVLTLMHLEAAGLLTARSITGVQTRWFAKVAKRLGAVFDGAKVGEDDVARGCFVNYMPLTTQFVRRCLEDPTGDAGEAVALAPGEYFDFSQPVPAKAPRNVVAVAFFGGVTAAEVALLRLLAAELGGGDEEGPEILVLTTGMTDGDSFTAQFTQGLFPTGPYDPRDFAGSGLFKTPSLWDAPQAKAPARR